MALACTDRRRSIGARRYLLLVDVQLARAAERARGGETVYINDLQSNERKIVHTIIGQENGVSSHSEGQEYNRYIVVAKEI